MGKDCAVYVGDSDAICPEDYSDCSSGNKEAEQGRKDGNFSPFAKTIDGIVAEAGKKLYEPRVFCYVVSLRLIIPDITNKVAILFKFVTNIFI